VQSVTSIYNFYKANNYETIVMGASFRNIGEIQALAGCDRLTISPGLMQELDELMEPLELRLDAAEATSDKKAVSIDEATFAKELNSDAMANEKLSTGIDGFVADQIKLEQLLAKL